jgi:hypothetical protein
MATAAQRIADLERQVAELAETVKRVAAEADIYHTIQNFDEMRLERQAGVWPAAPSRRPRHLHLVGGDR